MAVMPGAGSAIVELSKLTDYCLSETHPRGRHKARVFRNALGINAAEANWLSRALLEGLAACEATEIAADIYGIRWRADIPVTRQNKQAVVRTIWLLRGAEPPRFLTCWVL
jgi:hypothetical protein